MPQLLAWRSLGYCSQPPGGDQDALASLLGSHNAVHLHIQSMVPPNDWFKEIVSQQVQPHIPTCLMTSLLHLLLIFFSLLPRSFCLSIQLGVVQ